MIRDHYTFIAIILVYRNAGDLEECIQSMLANVNSLRIVVVNAFYDNSSELAISEIANKYLCDFISIENKGYSFGNNRGIEYALSRYNFDYIIISNPDIVIRRFEMPEQCLDIIAPRITAINGRAQNPMVVHRNLLSEKLTYIGFKRNNKWLIYAGIGLTKISREFTSRILKKNANLYPIYQPHGSFVILSKSVISKLHPIYDENMFLFAEENVLSMKAKDAGFQAYFWPKIEIEHKEDGSMKLAGTQIAGEGKKSTVYFYETYVRNKHR